MKRIRITISGKVQGVFFRKNAHSKAVALGLSGWERNLDNGGVMAEVQGEPFGVDQFVDWCRQGPDRARVTDVATEILPSRHERGFRIRY